MKPYERLVTATRAEREAFLRLPLVAQSVSHGATRETYLAFLAEAYHHVKHTFPLLALSASLTKDSALRAALAEYMKEEFGHEEWILEDIRRMGGDANAVSASQPRLACRVMVANVYYSVQWESPYAVLGMVHVLEGLSVILADKLAAALKSRFGNSSDIGFSYLRTHGALDVEHTAMFQRLMNGLEDPSATELIIEHTRIMYRLYGAIFEDLASLDIKRAA
jgi:pyrroloquinoline quinone (PQQ) biosynthesis protein C